MNELKKQLSNLQKETLIEILLRLCDDEDTEKKCHHLLTNTSPNLSLFKKQIKRTCSSANLDYYKTMRLFETFKRTSIYPNEVLNLSLELFGHLKNHAEEYQDELPNDLQDALEHILSQGLEMAVALSDKDALMQFHNKVTSIHLVETSKHRLLETLYDIAGEQITNLIDE